MKTKRAIQMTLLVGAFAAALMVSAPRPAHASDAGKVIGAIAAGVILHELLDDDDGARRPCYRPAYGPPYGRAYGFYGKRAPYGTYRGCGGWQPVQPGYRAPMGYEPTRSGVSIDVRRNPRGQTSVGIEYRDYDW